MTLPVCLAFSELVFQGYLAILVGAVCCLACLVDYGKWRRAQSWATTKGRVAARGEKVTVFYSEQDPSSCALLRDEIPTAVWGIGLMGVIAAVLGLLMI